MLPLPVKENEKTITDSEIVRRATVGEQAAFELLMRRYNRRLYRTARSIVKGDAEAEDVLQEAYLLAYRGIQAFRGDAHLLTWLTRIVANEAIARKRKTTRQAEVIQLDGDLNLHHQDAGESMDDNETERPESVVLRAEARRLLEAKIDQLPDAFRTVFVLRVLEEMTVEEVSAALGIPVATVRTRHFRAKGMLRAALSREFDFAAEEAFNFNGERCDRIVAGVLMQMKMPSANKQ